jgi:hypothetical protein
MSEPKGEHHMIERNKLRNIFLGALMLILPACNTNNQKAFQQSISMETDTIKIDNSKDTLIVGPKGTALFFEKDSFQLPDGTRPKGQISILLKECYSNSDIVRESLATTANGKLLDTRGMINVLAFSNSQDLTLKKGKKYIVHFPKDSVDRKKQMNLFYGKSNADGAIDWKLDSATLLKPTAFMSGWHTTGFPGGDTAQINQGIHIKGQKADSIYTYFYKHFDNSELQPVSGNLSNKRYEADFVVSKKGTIKHIKISEENYDGLGNRMSTNAEIDPYFYRYIAQIPTLEPFYEDDGSGQLKSFDADCGFYFSMGLYPPDYQNNEHYNKIFRQKYNAFKKSTITSMNEAELNFYIFSSSKLGWINCDFFWEVKDEKIDYYVKVEPNLKQAIKIVFKQAKSIMAGVVEGDKYVFRNVPINQEIKIVAIGFEGSKPLMAIAETKTSRQIFDQLRYKPFTLDDLEKQLGSR